MKRLLSVVYFLAILLSVVFSIPAYAEMNFSGKRAIFDEGSGWATREGADRTLKRIKEAGFNVYIPCIWHGRGVKWPSSRLSRWDPDLAGRPIEDDDPLRFLIGRAHEMGIEIHPWFTVVLRQSDLLPELASPGTPEDAFDVHDPRLHQLIADLVAEVVARYDVDGINLDYVRTMGLCASVSCKEAYKKKYGRDLTLDSIAFKLTPGRFPALLEFQEQAVTSMVKTIAGRVRAINPRALISVDAIPGVAGLDQGQNSIEWVNQGLVDVLFRMDYYRKINVELTESLRTKLKNPDALSLIISNVSVLEEMTPGQEHFSRDGKWLAETASMIQERWPRTGISVYFYKMLSEEQILALSRGPFRQPTNVKTRP
ncbi:MAG TPA: family 10 glycosylhydrolase [Nitrospiria bacterium]|jgi:uncharacterized lipoprotein YddW (UPF0748 family)|nr:family 10 glycosylhydrolase [Nitrospiria bacterium]